MERDIFARCNELLDVYFNSHAHVERDFRWILNRPLFDISTHTLTWSVTWQRLFIRAGYGNFNSHAHVERDTLDEMLRIKQRHFNSHAHVERDEFKLSKKLFASNFNSHAHVERDTFAFFFVYLITISTHTLTWSVTSFLFPTINGTNISTHTLTWSVTLDVVYIWCLLNVMRTYFFI